jgi:hypothetical protein
MMQTRVSSTCCVGVLIYSDGNVTLMFGLANLNGMNMLELYLNNRPRQWNFSSIELTWVPNSTQRTIQASQSANTSGLDSNTRNQTLTYKKYWYRSWVGYDICSILL